MRLIKLLVTLVIGAALLSACGSDEPKDKPTVKPSASRDADGFTPEQREVADAADAYTQDFYSRGANPVEPAIEDRVTKRLLDRLGPSESKAVDKAGLQYIGSVKLTPEKVTIQGDKATFVGCQDGSKAYIVKRGEKAAGVGSRPVATAKITIGMILQDGTWLVDDPQGTVTESC